MERAEWLKQMRAHAEALYDSIAPNYWVTFGFYPNAVHMRFIQKFLSLLPPSSSLLSAACGAGRYDGLLVEAGHRVLGIDQSARMLARAREHFPAGDFPTLRYEKIGLQEMDFPAEFDGAICVDAMENVCPEDWPGVVTRFQQALKPGGWLYFTVELPDMGEVRESYERALAQDLPVVFGELADFDPTTDETSQPTPAVYHYYPSMDQVRAWLAQSGLRIEEESEGDEYWHILARKTA